MHNDLNMDHVLHFDVWIRIFKLLDSKELKILESVCRCFNEILKDRMSFCYRHLSSENDVAKYVIGSEELQILHKSECTKFIIRPFLEFTKHLSLTSPEGFTYCTRPDGSMFFISIKKTMLPIHSHC